MSKDAGNELTSAFVKEMLRERRLDRRQRYWGHIFRIIIVVIAIGGGILSYSIVSGDGDESRYSTTIQATFTGSGEGIASMLIIPVRGVIVGDPLNNSALSSGGFLTDTTVNTVLAVRRALENATDLPGLAEIIFFVESPGGGITPSDEIYSMLRNWRAAHSEIRVSAYFYGSAASGAYYVAMAADTLAANPTSLVGSIGVIMEIPNVAELAERLGVKMTTIRTGEFKDMGNMFRNPTEAEIDLLNNLAMQAYDRFVDVVAEGRPGLTRERISALADGRVFSAHDALEAGLVDEIVPTFDAFIRSRVDLLRNERDFGELRVVLSSGRSRSLLDLFF